MVTPFINNHQYNFIKRQAGIVQHSSMTVTDPKVVEAVKYSAEAKILEMFPEVTAEQIRLLVRITALETAEDLQHFLSSLAPYLMEFPRVTENQLKKLFPKNKKLKLPDLSVIDYRGLTYLGWLDIATSKLFIVYELDGKLVGIEGRFTPVNKKAMCALCNSYGEVALVTAVTKKRPANATPDYYRAVGNYICTDSHVCNNSITDVTYLERFIHNVIS